MDRLNFNKEETIVFEGHYLPDMPLAGPLTQHYFNGATITQIVRELDMSKKSPIKIKNETFGIYGYSDFASPTSNASYGDKKVIISAGTA